MIRKISSKNVVLSTSDPTSSDIYSIGFHWINQTAETIFALVSVTAGVATWTEVTTEAIPIVDGLIINEGTTPGQAGAGTGEVWVDSFNGHIMYNDDAGNVYDLTSTGAEGATVYRDYILGDPGSDPDIGRVRLYFDTDGILRAIDSSGDNVMLNAIEKEVGNAGSVQLVEDVESASIKPTLFGSPFVLNALGRDGDSRTLSGGASSFWGDKDAFGVGDVVLYRCEVTANDSDGTFMPANTSVTATIMAAISYSTRTKGIKFALTTVSAIGSSVAVKAQDTGSTGSTTSKNVPFNLTKLGTINTEQVLMLASLGVTATTSDVWSNIANLTGYADTIWDTLIPSHVSGLQPSKVIKVVNRGNNLAYITPSNSFLVAGNNLSALIASGLRIYNTVATAYSYSKWFFKLEPNTQYTFHADLNAIDGDAKIVIQNSSSTSATITTSTDTTVTTDSTGEMYILLYSNSTAGAVTGEVLYTNIQLNEGATALPYSTPRNSPFLMGSESVNQSDANEYDDTDEVTFTALADGPYMLASDATGTWATGAEVTAITDLVAGESKTWTGLGASVVEHMVLAGEYTQAEVRALGFVAYKPVLLLNSGDGSDNVSDYLKQVGADVFKFPQVETVDGFEYGDDEVDSTSITSGTLTVGRQYLISDFIAGDDFTNVGGTNVDGDVFIATGTTPTTWTNSSDLNAYNTWQNTSQAPINMTENGLALTALDQPAVKGKNHEIVEGNLIVTVEHSIGLSASIASQSRVIETKADKSEVPHINPLKITSTSIIGAAVDTVIQFSDIADYPDFFGNPVYTEATKDANVASFVVFPNAVVITTDGTGTGAGDTLLLIDISEAEALISHTLA